MKNVALYNLGCKVNSYEMEGMRQALLEKGYHIVPFDEVADVYIVNTCTVTNIADRKSRQMLHRAKQLNPEAVVVAVGCYVQTGQDKVEKDQAVDLAVGNNRKKDIAEILEEYFETVEYPGKNAVDSVRTPPEEREPGEGKGIPAAKRDKTLQGTTVLDMNHTYEYEEMQIRQTGEHTRAYIKIQDGCNQFCSYCAIPYARGRVRSRLPRDIVREIQGLAETGYREVVLTGIHISSYGIDFGDAGEGKGKYAGQSRLVELAERIQEIQGIDRIRLGSLEPRIITPDTARRLAALPKLCPHFHLSLQSGCDATLKRMNRHYTTGEYYNSVESLRRYFDRPAVTTDVIVGFPGETEEEFDITRAFLEKVKFYEMHIFKYSRRAGTAADRMPEQVPEQIKSGRSAELLELEKQQSKEFRKHYIGKEAEVLLEERQEISGRSFWVGHTRDYVKVAVEEKHGRTEKPVPGENRAEAEGTAADGPKPDGGKADALQANLLVKVPITGFLTEEILA